MYELSVWNLELPWPSSLFSYELLPGDVYLYLFTLQFSQLKNWHNSIYVSVVNRMKGINA